MSEPIHTFYLVSLQGRTIGRHAMTWPDDAYNATWLQRRFYPDVPSCVIARDPDQRYPNDGGAPIGRWKKGAELDKELVRLAKRHTWEAIRDAVDRLEP